MEIHCFGVLLVGVFFVDCFLFCFVFMTSVFCVLNVHLPAALHLRSDGYLAELVAYTHFSVWTLPLAAFISGGGASADYNYLVAKFIIVLLLSLAVTVVPFFHLLVIQDDSLLTLCACVL